MRPPARRPAAAALATVTLAAALAGCAFRDTAATATEAAPAVDAARLYLRHCSACHGESGDGKGLAQSVLLTPPRDFTTEEARLNLSREYMIAIVRDGRPHTAMSGRAERLGQEPIEAVVDFVRVAFVAPAPGSVRARGRAVYRQSCALCHGDRGQGTTRPDGRTIPALSRARAAPGLDDARLAAAVARPVHVPGVSLPPFGLAEADVAAVVRYVRTSFVEYGAPGRGPGTAGAR